MLIVLPSLVSGLGVAFILIAVFVDNAVLRIVFGSLGAALLWADFFVTMAIFRHTVRSIDRRLHHIELELERDANRK